MDKKIGQLIKDRVTAKNIAVTEFAKKIGVERSNVYDIFKRDSIDTKLLKKIGQVLNYDFFQDLLEDDTLRNLCLKSKIDKTIYVPIHLSEEEVKKLSLTERVLDNLNKKND